MTSLNRIVLNGYELLTSNMMVMSIHSKSFEIIVTHYSTMALVLGVPHGCHQTRHTLVELATELAGW